MRNLTPSWDLETTQLLAAVAPAWAAPGVTNLTTPKLPANATRAASTGTPTPYNIASVPGWSSAMPSFQASNEVPQPASAALHCPLPTHLIL